MDTPSKQNLTNRRTHSSRPWHNDISTTSILQSCGLTIFIRRKWGFEDDDNTWKWTQLHLSTSLIASSQNIWNKHSDKHRHKCCIVDSAQTRFQWPTFWRRYVAILSMSSRLRVAMLVSYSWNHKTREIKNITNIITQPAKMIIEQEEWVSIPSLS